MAEGQAPYQLLNGPVNIYFGDPQELPPDVATPTASISAAWTLFGTSGDKDILEEGVKITAEQDVSKFRGLGSVGTRKMFRNGQEVMIEFALADISAEYVSKAFNENTINLDSHRRHIELLTTATVEQTALLIRSDKSPYGEFNHQWWFPRCSDDSNREFVYVKGEPVAVRFRFTALEDTTYGIGTFEAQDEAS